MADESFAKTGQESEKPAESTASKDLADGLDLMLRAAKKAVRNVEPAKLEELGKRALKGLESLDSAGIGRKAARAIDVHKIEEIAQDAGKELLGVVERVAERVEAMVGVGGKRQSAASADAKAPSSAPQEAGDATETADASAPPPRIRVDNN
jgi:hypothetical protein